VENYNNTINLFFNAISILVISNHNNSFRVLFDKILPYILFAKYILYFSIGNGQPKEPALCQLYQHTFVPYMFLLSTYNNTTPGCNYLEWVIYFICSINCFQSMHLGPILNPNLGSSWSLGPDLSLGQDTSPCQISPYQYSMLPLEST